ncbi:hypothetical protein [Bradyrhizobium sp. CCBAU 53338]|uniref:hypothetical protein n=1 Tax=Bradyrhizobium sp. CCBAU 53338 TaxID=1325111 RepID=UPI00188C3480|nr:hypothetical protein [Bradyrhizobium sp. CCBAU 53338]QOZ52865.1 hypothetical protein XH90_16965 [Bradyrhizobium sp. CCBAU 53338]
MIDQPQEAFLATAYTHVDNGWRRSFSWTWSRTRNDCFETVYTRPTGGGGQRVRVRVHKSYIKDATAAIFEINGQLKQEAQAEDEKRHRRRRRRPRPGKRAREAMRQVAAVNGQ